MEAPQLPKVEKTENVEAQDAWRELRASAPEAAQKLMFGIEGFTTMPDAEKAVALSKLIERLSEDNKNRYVAGEIARERAIYIEKNRYEEAMKRLVA